jgi:hypothetical protein
LVVSTSGVMPPLRRKRTHSNARPRDHAELACPSRLRLDCRQGKRGYLFRTLGCDSKQDDAAFRRQAPVVRQLAKIFVESQECPASGHAMRQNLIIGCSRIYFRDPLDIKTSLPECLNCRTRSSRRRGSSCRF